MDSNWEAGLFINVWEDGICDTYNEGSGFLDRFLNAMLTIFASEIEKASKRTKEIKCDTLVKNKHL